MATYNRIISLVPSLTELLIDFGFKDQLVGRTRFCTCPKDVVEEIPIVGGTKNPRLDKINESEPDLIIANKEENKKEHIRELAENFTVKLTDIATIEDALITIHEIGKMLNVEQKAQNLTTKISQELEKRPDEPSQRVAYLIWQNPWMTVGKDTYIDDVLSHWNLQNVFKDERRYPKIELKEINRRYPDLILLSSEPFPFKEKHISNVEKGCPDKRILLVDGQWFSWYGSRMLESFKKLNVWRKAIA